MTFPDSDRDAEIEDNDEIPSGLTLDDLHEELVAATSEARRGERRTLDVLKNFGSVLDALSATVNDTHKAVRAIPAATARQPDGGELPREWALALVEMADRIGRVSDGFSRPPAAATGWWPGSRKPLAAWSDAWAMQADALGILSGHADTLLNRAGLQRLEVVGKPFDPATMTAVESAVDPGKPDHTVLSELLPGWRHAESGQLVRPAQVRVSRVAAR
ncbi:nucleotide exchange factor GrpE [bacterium]|nr:nucleotide exchange factor GrpE [bacterium]